MRPHVVFLASLAAVSFSLLAHTASAENADDDDDGYIAGAATPATEVAPSTPVECLPPPPPPKEEAAAIPKEEAATPKIYYATFDWGAPEEPKHETKRAEARHEMRDQSPAEDPHAGALGPVRLGALAGVGAPSIFSGEVLAKIGDYMGIAGDYGMAPSLPLAVGSSVVSVQQQTFTGSARVYPFRNWFFVGAGAGSQTVSATAAASSAVPGASFRTSVLFLEPEIGVLYRTSSGIAIGCDIGLEFPVTSQRTNSELMPGGLDRMMKYAEKGPIPTVDLLRIGYVL